MKKILILIVMVCAVLNLNAQQNIIFNTGGNPMYASPISTVDSLKFDNTYSRINQGGASLNIQKIYTDSITFSSQAVTLDKIYIIYNGNDDATIINPYADQGLTITADGGHVTGTGTTGIANLEYHLLGTSSDAYLTLNSDKDLKLIMYHVNITNPNGNTIAISGGNKTTFYLFPSLSNTVVNSSTTTGNAAIKTDGDAVINGSGFLTVSSAPKHGISTSGTLTMENGTVIITSAASDGIHSEGFIMQNGSLEITASGDGIDAGDSPLIINNGSVKVTSTVADTKAIKTGAADLTINGGTINIFLSGNQSKGISSKHNVIVNDGSITVNVSGNVVLEAAGNGYDPSYPTGIKADSSIYVNGGKIDITITSSANGGKGFSSDIDININGGEITINSAGGGAKYTDETGAADAYASSGLKSDNSINLKAGKITISMTGTAGKGISSDKDIIIGETGADNTNLVISVTTSGGRILVSGSGQNADYSSSKAIKADNNVTVNSGTITISCTQSEEGAEGLESKNVLTINGGILDINTYDDAINASNSIIINGGNVYCKARGNDGIDSNGTLTINGGFTISNGARAPEEGFDCDQNTFKITGGIIVGTGGATSDPTTSVSTQRSIKVTTSFTTNAETAITISNNSGYVLMYKIPAFATASTGGPGGGPGGGNSSTLTLLFTDPAITTGSYTISKGGTISGGTENHGYVTGGTYSGGTSSTFSVSGMLTTVNL